MQWKQPEIKLYLAGKCCPPISGLRSDRCIASVWCAHLTAELRLVLGDRFCTDQCPHTHRMPGVWMVEAWGRVTCAYSSRKVVSSHQQGGQHCLSTVLEGRGSSSSCIMHLSTSQLSQSQIDSHSWTLLSANTNSSRAVRLVPGRHCSYISKQQFWRGVHRLKPSTTVQHAMFHFSRPLIVI